MTERERSARIVWNWFERGHSFNCDDGYIIPHTRSMVAAILEKDISDNFEFLTDKASIDKE